MKRTVSSISKWAFGLILSSITTTLVAVHHLDPTDDFSFSLHPKSGPQAYSLMSPRRMSEILADRLDLFPQSQTRRLAHHIIELCKKHRLDPAFILSLIDVESSFRIKAVSPVGAVGLMQVMLPTAQYVRDVVGIRFSGYEDFNPEHSRKVKFTQKVVMNPFMNTAIGIAYLAWLRDYYKGTPYHVLAAYNVGPARLNELIARKNFHPVETKRYFLAIRRNVPQLRFYRKPQLGSVL